MDVHAPDVRAALMSRIRSCDTEPELAVRRALRAMNVKFRLHGAGLPGRPDLVLPGRRTVVFVHGCFWHGHTCTKGRSTPKTNRRFWTDKLKANKQRDRRVARSLTAAGWKVVTIWECGTRNVDALREALTRAIT